MHLPENSISCAMSSLVPLLEAIKNQGGPVTCSFSNRMKEKPSASFYRDSLESMGISKISIQRL